MYDLHKSLILQKNEKGKLVKVYNFLIDNGVTFRWNLSRTGQRF